MVAAVCINFRGYTKKGLDKSSPKGENLRSTGWLLKKKKYRIRILDLVQMERSHCYNPFVYLRDDNDVQRLVTNLFKATTPKGSTSSDPFWDTAAQMLLLALIFYLKYEAPEDEQNFAMVMEMLRAGDVDEEDSKAMSALDTLFYDLRKTDPDHIALKYYDAYHSGSGKTLKSIQITLASRLEKFNLESVAGLTITDELDLWKLGEEKTALFAIIPDNDTSFNFLVSLLYTQIFQQLFEVADKKYGGSLPVHVQFLMDEFVYLGGNEQATHKYVSELLGKETSHIIRWVRINREIRDYTESMFFGLSLRQFFFSVLACGVAVGIYLGLNPILGTETTSWLCIVAAFPFAVMGFLKYNGMTAEKFIAAWIKSTFMIPKVLLFGNTNYYFAMLADESPETAKKCQFHRRGGRKKRKVARKQDVKNKKQRRSERLPN